MAEKILIIDDDEAVRNSLRISLEELSTSVDTEGDGAQGLLRGLESNYDAVVIDIQLPGMNGLDICRKLRAAKPLLPILLLTSRSSELDVVLGLEQGADDYLTKPFRIAEALARIRALLRRGQAQKAFQDSIPVSKEVTIGGLSIDIGARTATLEGVSLQLTALEFDLLAFFAERQGRTVPKEQLMESVWGYLAEDVDSSIYTVLSRLRKKLGSPQREFIHTVRGVGYRFQASE